MSTNDDGPPDVTGRTQAGGSNDPRPSLTAQVRRRRTDQQFFLRLQRLSGKSVAEGPPWEWLENHPRLSAADVRQLRTWYAEAYSGRRIPLERLHNLIVRTERQLAA